MKADMEARWLDTTLDLESLCMFVSVLTFDIESDVKPPHSI